MEISKTEQPASGAPPKKDTRFKTTDVTKTKGLTFEEFDLPHPLQLAIYECGYDRPSPIQEESIPIALAEKNIIARAKNGTGKTGAYAIPLISKIDPEQSHIQGLVLVPTRELALQTSQVIKDFSKYLKLEVMVSTGGTAIKEDILRLYKTVHILVGTPGRILDLATKKVADLQHCTTVVLDEVDKLLSIDFKPIIENLFHEALPKEPQIMLFSATYPKEIKQFQQEYVKEPVFINLMDELTLKGVT